MNGVVRYTPICCGYLSGTDVPVMFGRGTLLSIHPPVDPGATCSLHAREASCHRTDFHSMVTVLCVAVTYLSLTKVRIIKSQLLLQLVILCVRCLYISDR